MASSKMSFSKDEIYNHLGKIQFLQRLQKPLLSSVELAQVITNVIQTNFEGCDMILTLFISALNSSRSDFCLRPFPQHFVKYDLKNDQALRKFCDNIPSLQEFLVHPTTYPELLELFWWLFIEKGFPVLQLILFRNDILPSTIPESFKPNYMFEVHHHCKVDEIFETRKADRNLISAYHGSRVDHFYSILKVGLQQHLSSEKENLFGNGIYLSSECSLSSHYSPYHFTWKNSSLGSRHSVIALCEIIDDIAKVKCKDSENRTRSINENATGEIPEKYFVVTDSDMVRLKYLLVYSKNELAHTKSFIRKNLFWLTLFLYMVILIFVGCDRISWKKYVKFVIGM